jgi:prophage tail gpP-like protein
MTNGTVQFPPSQQLADVLAPTTPGTWSASRYFDQIQTPPYLTRAVVIVNGELYYEWETVSVKLAILENPPYTFRLTVSEQEPWPADFSFLRIRPPFSCVVYLDGFQVIDGIVITRQVYYDSNQHTIEIQGAGNSAVLSKNNFPSQTGEFKNQNLEQIAKAGASPFGVNVSSEGNVPQDKFPRVGIQPGERVYDTVERLARAVGAVLTSNPAGDLVLMGIGGGGGGSTLIEGKNILTAHEIVHSQAAATNFRAISQKNANDDEWGAKVTHDLHTQQGGGQFSPGGSEQTTLSEHPAIGLDQLAKRARMEGNVSDWNQIYVTIETLGWQVPGGGRLWRPSTTEMVTVDAPMLILNNHPLYLKAVTFTQSNDGGTRSSLELVNATALSELKAQPD